MTTTATAAPPSPTAARRYSESLHVLTTRQTRELLVGLAALDAAGARPREGEAIRELLDDAIQRLYEADPDRYSAAMRKGRAILRKRDAAKAAPAK